MKDKIPPRRDRRSKVTEAERIVEAIKNGQADAIIGKEHVLVLRLKEAEQGLREREKRYRGFVERNPDPVFCVDTTGKFLEVNLAASKVSGRAPEELLRMRWRDLCHPDFLDATMRAFKAALDGESRGVETAIIHKDGSLVNLYLTGGPMVVGDRTQGVFVIAHNLTEFKKAEESLLEYQAELEQQNEELRRAQAELSEARNQYFELYELAPVGYLTLDAGQVIRQANLAAASLFGRERRNIVGERLEKIVAFEDRDLCHVHLREVAAERSKKVCELRLLGSGDSIFWGSMETVAVGGAFFAGTDAYRVTITDVTARKEFQRQFEIQQQRLRLAVESGGIGLWERDLRAEKVLWSDSLFDLLGLERGSHVGGEDFFKHIHEEDRHRVRRHARKWFSAGGEFRDEFRIVRADDGRVRWFAAVGRTYNDSDGRPLRAAGVNIDITDRKELEEERRRTNEMLERRVAEQTAEVRQQADQLRGLAVQLGETEQRERRRLAQVLHDHIQQLIVAARMQVSWIEHDNDPERLRTTVQAVDAILHEALEASRSLAIDLSPPVLQETGLVGALSWLASRMKERNQFTVNLRAGNNAEPETEQVRFLIFECARELLLNVMKHAGVREADLSLVRVRDDRLTLVVRDKGKGFDPGELTARSYSNPSFGLFNIQQRLSHVGGSVEIDAAPGRGTRVSVVVPADGAQSEGDEALETAGRGDLGRKSGERREADTCRVLIVDDHKIMREGLVTLLEFERDMEVAGEAGDGARAIELAGELRPDVVVMDVSLGEMGGVEATQRIVSKNPEIKVIGLSMHSDRNIAIAMREAGAVAYLTKSELSGDLIATIRACHKGSSPPIR